MISIYTNVIEQIIGLFTALLTPVIAIIAVYIALQQWKTNQQRLNLEQYDRRLRVYEEVRNILRTITTDENIKNQDLYKFDNSVSEADFLFGPDIKEYIKEIFDRGIKLIGLMRQIQDGKNIHLPKYDPNKANEEIDKERRWFIKQLEKEIAKEKFKKYLNLGKI